MPEDHNSESKTESMETQKNSGIDYQDPDTKRFIKETIEYQCRNGNLSETSVNAYRDRLVTVVNRAVKMKIPINPTKITSMDGNRFIDELLQNGLGINTVKLYVKSLTDYTLAHGNRSLENLDSKKLKPVKKKWLSQFDLNHIFSTVLTIEEGLIFHLMLCFGFTKSDITLMRLEDIDFVNKRITIRNQDGTLRVMPFHVIDDLIPQDTEQLLKEYLEYRDNLVRWKKHINHHLVVPDTLFVYYRGDEIFPFLASSTSIENRLREITKLTGVRLTEKTILITFARYQVYNGVSTEEIESQIGIRVEFNYCKETKA